MKGNRDKVRGMLMVEKEDRLLESGRLKLVQRHEAFGDKCKHI